MKQPKDYAEIKIEPISDKFLSDLKKQIKFIVSFFAGLIVGLFI